MTWRATIPAGLNTRHLKLPVELQTAIRDKSAVTYSFYERFKSYYSSTALKVCFNCECCGAEHVSNFKHLNKRTLVKSPVCPSCVMKVVTNDVSWRSANSKAQLEIQSTSSQKKKNADGVSKFWKNNPDKLQHMREACVAYNQSELGREKNRQRKQHNGRGISGDYLSKWGWLNFDSSYELAFILHLEMRGDLVFVKRGPIIEYQLNGRGHQFFMDFEVGFDSGQRWWCEVKSGYVGRRIEHMASLRAKLATSLDLIKAGHADRVVLVTETSAPEIFGFRMPRSNRKKMFQENVSKIIFNDERNEQRYR